MTVAYKRFSVDWESPSKHIGWVETDAPMSPAIAERLSFTWGRHNLTAMLLAMAPPSRERCAPHFVHCFGCLINISPSRRAVFDYDTAFRISDETLQVSCHMMRELRATA